MQRPILDLHYVNAALDNQAAVDLVYVAIHTESTSVSQKDLSIKVTTLPGASGVPL